MESRRGFTLIDLVMASSIITVLTAVSIAPFAAGGRVANERYAVASLKHITIAQQDFRSNDRDGNRTMDFWTADVYGLYGMIPITGAAIVVPPDSADAETYHLKLIEPSLAAADGRTDQALYANVEFASTIGRGATKRGYVFRALHNEVTGGTATTLLYDTDGAAQFYGPCHDVDRFAAIAFPVSLTSGRSLFIVNEDNTIWKYVLPANYTAAFAGASGAATDSSSTTGGIGLEIEFTLAPASGQGTFPQAPAKIGCDRIDKEPPTDWNALARDATVTLSEAIDKGLKESGEGSVVLLAEIERDGSKVVCALDIAKGSAVVATTLDLKDGKVVSKGAGTDGQSVLTHTFKVTAKAAIEVALKETPGQAMAVELRTHKNQPIIAIRIWAKDKLKIAAVNGETGDVIAVEELKQK